MKTKIALLVILLALAITPAQVEARSMPKASLFAVDDTYGVGFVLPYKNMEIIPATAFNVAEVGAFVLQDNLFRSNYSGIYRVTGRCYQFYPDNLLRIYALSSDGTFLVANGLGKFFDFTFVTASQWVQFGASTEPQGWNLLKCQLLFEVVP